MGPAESTARSRVDDALSLSLGLAGLAMAAGFVSRALVLFSAGPSPRVAAAIVYFAAAAAQSLPMIGLPVYLRRRWARRPVLSLHTSGAAPLKIGAGLVLLGLAGSAVLFGLRFASIAALASLAVLCTLGLPLLVLGVFFKALVRPGGELGRIWFFLSTLIIGAGALAAATFR